MKNINKINFLFLFVALLCFSFGISVSAQSVGGANVQTNSATIISDYQATLNGYFAVPYLNNSNYVYFQWGLTNGYGNQTSQQNLNYSGTFSQIISGLSNNTTYHFRAVAEGSFGTIYGQDITFTTTSSGNNYNNYVSAQTNYATYVSNYQATLNGSLLGNNSSQTNYVYFQWGTSTGYGNQTPQQSAGSAQTFMQNIENLNSNTLYHFRIVAVGNYGTIYGQDMTFSTSGSGTNYNGNNSLSINKQVIDITSGNLIWAQSINAKPSDILSFAITLQANGQDVHNVIVRDVLPANLMYRGNLMENTNSNYNGDIVSGINIGTVYVNQPVVVSYQVQVASDNNFTYGATILANNASVTSNEAGVQNASATVIVNKTLVYGASTVSTGLTNNFFADSFFLPLIIIVGGLWFYFSGEIYYFVDKLKKRVRK